MNTSFLTSLESARWPVVFRTYGCSHSTLVGLLVDWWISQAPGNRWALEGGPSFGFFSKGIGGGICDAVLGEGDTSRGVCEVEGSRYEDTLRKIGSFFSSDLRDLQTLEFGVFLAYPTSPEGRGAARHMRAVPAGALLELGKEVTRANPGKSLVILALEKEWERQCPGPRARNDYYRATPTQVRGWLLLNGDVLLDDFLVGARLLAGDES